MRHLRRQLALLSPVADQAATQLSLCQYTGAMGTERSHAWWLESDADGPSTHRPGRRTPSPCPLPSLSAHVQAYEAAHPPELEKRTVKKKKKLKKKLKKAPAESETDAAGPSTSRPKSPVPLRQLPVGQSYQLNPSFSAMPPSAFKADYPRPVSALAASACAGPSGALSSYQLSVPARPVRPKSAMPSRPLPPAGPSARIAAEPWREVSPPKYTAASRKEPE